MKFCVECGFRLGTPFVPPENVAPPPEPPPMETGCTVPRDEQRPRERVAAVNPETRISIAEAFGYPFRDKEWYKPVLIIGLLIHFPIVNLIALAFVLGYFVELIHRVMEGDEMPLTPLDFWRQLLTGLKYLVPGVVIWPLCFVVALPLAAVVVTLLAALGVGLGLSMLGPVDMQQMGDFGGFLAFWATLYAITGVFYLAVALTFVILVPIYLALFIVAATRRRPLWMFNLPGFVLIVARNFRAYLTTGLGVMLFLLLSLAGLVVGVGTILTVPLMMFMSGHLIGQFGQIVAAREQRRKGKITGGESA